MSFWEEDDREKSEEDCIVEDLGNHQHSRATQHIFRVLRRFSHNISDSTHLKKVLEQKSVYERQKDVELDSDVCRQQPERYIEDNLVKPILAGLGHQVLFRPSNYPKWTDSVPDFAITNFNAGVTKNKTGLREGCRVIGEVKTPHNVENAEEEIKEYLNEDAGVPAVGLATDGLSWKAWAQPKGRGKKEILDFDLTQPALKFTKEYLKEEEYNNKEIRDLIEGKGVIGLEKANLEEGAARMFR